MKRPLVLVGLCYAAGVLVAEIWQPHLAWLFAAGIVSALVALCIGKLRPALVWVSVFLTGWTSMTYHTAALSPQDLRGLEFAGPELVQVRGVLEETPSPRSYMRKGQEQWRNLARLQVNAILRDGKGWEPATGRVLVTSPGRPDERFFAGARVELSGLLEPPPVAVAEGMFDYRAVLRRQGIHYVLKTGGADSWLRLSPADRKGLSERFVDWAQRALSLGIPERDAALQLLWAMTLGWKTGLTNEVYEPFMQSGTMHIFAISGLHIVLIAGFLTAALRAVRIPRAWACGLSIPLLWLYTMATGWQPSAVRATIMMTVVLAGYCLARPHDLINSLFAAAIGILLWDPQQLFGASFQLSFLVVLSLALTGPPLQRLAEQLRFHDPLLPQELRPGWQRGLEPGWRWLIASGITSLAAWFGAVPLTAHYFHLVSPVTLVANIVVVPLSGFALAANLGSLVAVLPFPWLAELLNNAAWGFMWLMMRLSEWAARVPGGYWHVESPSAVDYVVWYGLVVGISTGWLLKPQWKVSRPLPLVLIAVAIGYLSLWAAGRGRTEIAALPVNGGMAVLVKTSTGGTWLIDAGPEDRAEWVLKPFLQANGINRLAGLVLTHGDSKHIGGTAAIVETFPPSMVYTNALPQRSTVYKRQLKEVASRRLPGGMAPASDGDTLGPWKVLHPCGTGKPAQRADDSATVLLATLSGVRVLLVSDLGPAGQQTLLERHRELRADLIITGLPATGEPLCDELLGQVNPKVIVVCDSQWPSQERADAFLRERLFNSGGRVFFTQQTGAVTIDLKAGEIRVRSRNPHKPFAKDRGS